MKKMTRLTASVLVLGPMALTVGTNLAYADDVTSPATIVSHGTKTSVQTGVAKVVLSYASALSQAGHRAPEYDAAAKQQLSTVPTHYLQKEVTINYSIDPETGIESAVAILSNSDDSGTDIAVELTPMGMVEKYSFIGFIGGHTQIAFSIDTNFENPSAYVLVKNPNGEFNSRASSFPG